jgi:hypothetical protein
MLHSTPTSAIAVKLQSTVYAFQICLGEVKSAQGLCLIMFPGGSMVSDTYMFDLQIHMSSFETDWLRKMAQHREAFHGLGVQDVTELDSD